MVASGPDQNFVEVHDDLSNLEESVTTLLASPEKARTIAANSAATFRDRYLTPAAQACYWRAMVRGWAEVSFEPDLWESASKTGGRRRTRGVTFESFV